MPDSAEDNGACRICMDPKDNYVSLFSFDLSKKVMEIADVQVEKDDGLPNSICTECEQDLEKCYEFRLKVQVADKKFRENIKFPQVDIEECNIKEESYVDDGNSDNMDDKDSVSMDDEQYNDVESDVAPKITEETETAVPDPLNHVVVVEEKEKKIDVSNELLCQDDAMTEEPRVQKIEEVALDQLTCMKEEAETEIMDVDSSQPDPFGPSSSVRTTELRKSIPNLLSTPSSSGDANAKNTFFTEINRQPVVSSRTTQTQQFPMQENKQGPLLPAVSSRGGSAHGHFTVGEDQQPSQGYVLIPHQLGLDTGLLIPFVPVTPPSDAVSQSYIESLGDTPLNISSSRDDSRNKNTATAATNVAHAGVQDRPARKCSSTDVDKSSKNTPSVRVDVIDKPVSDSTDTKPAQSFYPPPQREVETEGKDEFFCSVCNVDFGFPDRLEEHKSGKEFICRSCTAIFNNHRELEAHFVSHRKFICKVCKQVFYVKSDLLHHKDTVLSCKRPEILKCRYCHNRFVHESNLLTHIEVKHPNAETRPFTCTICNSSFKIQATLREHLKSCHTVYESMECDICHKILPGPSSLKTHVKNKHLQTVSEVCPICNKVLASKIAFKLHMEIHTGEEKVCYICGAVIKGKKTFKQHIYYHENKRRSCSFCNIAFNSQTEKNRHYREKHSTSKSCMCEICGKEFKAIEILRNHMLTHSDEKPYECGVCGAAFKSKAVLKTHSRVHSDLRKYICNHCGEAFRWKQTFDKHVLKCELSQNETGAGSD